MVKQFSVMAMLGDKVYPFVHKFSDGPFAGLEIRFNELPQHWDEIAVESVSAEAERLGFSAQPLVLHRIGGIPLTGGEYSAYEDAYDRLTSREKMALEKALNEATISVLSGVVGGWNQPEEVKDYFPELLRKYRSLCQSVFSLAMHTTLTPQEKKLSAT